MAMLVRRVVTPIRFARGTRAPAVARGLSTTTARPSVAVVGVGQMGAAVAANLLRSAVDVHLFDLAGAANVPPALQQDQLAGATWAASAAEAARAASVVITALPRPENVSAAFEAPGGLLEGLRPGTTWIEHSTTDFENTLRIKDAIEARGCFAVEAPLTGGMQVRKREDEKQRGREPALLSSRRMMRHHTITPSFGTDPRDGYKLLTT